MSAFPTDSLGRLLHQSYDYRIGPARDEAWKRYAACRGMGPELFFPERGSDISGYHDSSNHPAIQICRECPVRDDCREYGQKERFGIWGGMTGRQRRIQRRAS